MNQFKKIYFKVKTLPRPKKTDDLNSTLKRSRRHSRTSEWFAEKSESVKDTLVKAKDKIQRQISSEAFRPKSPLRQPSIRTVQSQVELRETVRKNNFFTINQGYIL